ncbi:unnamed protein product [Calicophoron daubneyi]|uniref:Lipocalin/cytosolic fatty-acid binding domain-containing protein n=1 Tax=Calicophoron daubneyi TaxID=300641 RepID=A0AAV2TT38_CALDB
MNHTTRKTVMAQLAGSWHCKSHHNMAAFLCEIGDLDGSVSEVEFEVRKLTITFPDPEHVVFEYRGNFGSHVEKCKFGSVCEYKGIHGKTFKTVLTKESETCMKSTLQDVVHPGHILYHLAGENLHVECITGDVRALSIYTRDQ